MHRMTYNEATCSIGGKPIGECDCAACVIAGTDHHNSQKRKTKKMSCSPNYFDDDDDESLDNSRRLRIEFDEDDDDANEMSGGSKEADDIEDDEDSPIGNAAYDDGPLPLPTINWAAERKAERRQQTDNRRRSDGLVPDGIHADRDMLPTQRIEW